MKKNLKKLGALLLAGAMVLGMSATAFAAKDGTFTDGNQAKGEWDLATETYSEGITAVDFNVHFDITVTDAKRPQTKFTYSIANGTEVAATATTPKIYAGITDGAKLAQTETDLWNTPNVTEAIDKIGLTFDATKFGHAGIFRYVITEAGLDGEQTAIGIEDGDLANAHKTNDLYLDVYVSKVNGNMTVTAAVLLDAAVQPTLSHTDGSVAGTLETATYASGKIDGFYNKYTSYSVTLQKEVTGDAGDTEYDFPFSMQLFYAEVGDTATTLNGVTVTATAEDTAKATVAASYNINTTATDISGITMKDGGKITLTGLPKMAVVKLKETVDAGEGYNITSVVTSMDASAARTAEDGTHTESAFVTTGTVNGADDADITYTNNRNSISPTGVVLRFAPYVLMLAAGVVLLLVSRRREA